ncbi:hypothetical protein BGE01nite_50880 [Brevifollis gellanilyticus]|uniref:Uncharacterized protein n=1 Tax=Brevifollis gellanilyticus TaxID=748831 RepID=A0A512MGC7_9BACT|nr:hypothetical protein BGE01nite_50880 [Brevifollis gellanilyticus]
MLAHALLTQVMHTQGNRPFFLGTAHDADAHGDSDKFGEKGDDIQTHGAVYAGDGQGVQGAKVRGEGWLEAYLGLQHRLKTGS